MFSVRYDCMADVAASCAVPTASTVAIMALPVCLLLLYRQEQVGPYVHRVFHERLDPVWDANGRVYFKVGGWVCFGGGGGALQECVVQGAVVQKQGGCASPNQC